jgi:hypothetical protein
VACLEYIFATFYTCSEWKKVEMPKLLLVATCHFMYYQRIFSYLVKFQLGEMTSQQYDIQPLG